MRITGRGGGLGACNLRHFEHGPLSRPGPNTHTTTMPMSTFAVPVTVANPRDPERRLTLELLVDTGSTWTLLPDEVVNELGLPTPWNRTVKLANGDSVTFPKGEVAMQLNGEEHTTLFLAGPAGIQGLMGAVTLEEFALAPDPVNRVLIPVKGLLAASA